MDDPHTVHSREELIKYSSTIWQSNRFLRQLTVGRQATENPLKTQIGYFYLFPNPTKNQLFNWYRVLLPKNIFPQIALAIGVLTSNRRGGGHQLWRGSRWVPLLGAIAGCHCEKKLTRVLHRSPLHLSLD